MKRMIAVAAVGLAAALSGCKSLPTPAAMHDTAYATGCAAGLVANETSMDAKSRGVVIDILGKVKDMTPAVGSTFRDTWDPVTRKYVADLVAAGKLDAGQAALVVAGVDIAALGLDYVFEKYPTAKEYKDLVTAALGGFTEGFLLTFRPVGARAEVKSNAIEEKHRETYVDAYIKIKARAKTSR